MLIRFDMIHERDRQTDRRRMPTKAALMHRIARQKLRNGISVENETGVILSK